MSKILEKATELKQKALELVEEKLSSEIDCHDLKTLCECINIVGTDNNFYMKTLTNLAMGKIGKEVPPIELNNIES